MVKYNKGDCLQGPMSCECPTWFCFSLGSALYLSWIGLLLPLSVLAKNGLLDLGLQPYCLVALWGSDPSGHWLSDTGTNYHWTWPYGPNCLKGYNCSLQSPPSQIWSPSCAQGPLVWSSGPAGPWLQLTFFHRGWTQHSSSSMWNWISFIYECCIYYGSHLYVESHYEL